MKYTTTDFQSIFLNRGSASFFFPATIIHKIQHFPSRPIFPISCLRHEHTYASNCTVEQQSVLQHVVSVVSWCHQTIKRKDLTFFITLSVPPLVKVETDSKAKFTLSYYFIIFW